MCLFVCTCVCMCLNVGIYVYMSCINSVARIYKEILHRKRKKVLRLTFPSFIIHPLDVTSFEARNICNEEIIFQSRSLHSFLATEVKHTQRIFPDKVGDSFRRAFFFFDLQHATYSNPCCKMTIGIILMTVTFSPANEAIVSSYCEHKRVILLTSLAASLKGSNASPNGSNASLNDRLFRSSCLYARMLLFLVRFGGRSKALE